MEEAVDWGADSPGDGGGRHEGDGAATGVHGETKENQGKKRKPDDGKEDEAEPSGESVKDKPSEGAAPGDTSEVKPAVDDDDGSEGGEVFGGNAPGGEVWNVGGRVQR